MGKSLKRLLNPFFTGSILPTFDYSLLRPEGTIIKTFGGKSAGPEPLIALHKAIIEKLTQCIGKPISITNIVDIMNLIGVCVVAGNIRKSAQIVFGNPENEFLKLKDYRWNEETQKYEGTNIQRAGFGWCSNNTIFANVGMDYEKVSQQTGKNGEPGYFWLENART